MATNHTTLDPLVICVSRLNNFQSMFGGNLFFVFLWGGGGRHLAQTKVRI